MIISMTLYTIHYTVYNRDKVKTKNINIDVGKTDQNIIQKYDI